MILTVEKLSYSIPEKYLYQDISFAVEEGQHCVLIGSNGTGKTTLLDILLHPEDYIYKGKIRRAEPCRIGYVNQFDDAEKERDITAFQYLCEEFAAMQARLDALCGELETAEDYEAASDRYQQAVDEYLAIDGYDHETNAHKQMKLAGIETLEEVPLRAVSGGEYKLLQIIRQMMLMPDLLVMDEPDIFLDFDNLNGLRQLINAHRGTILAVTHNRYLLNHCFDKVLHIENQSLREFDGSYTDYQFMLLQMKAELQEKSAKEAEWITILEQMVERMRDDASKHISLRKGKVLRAKVSYLEHWKAWHTDGPFVENRQPKIRFPEVEAKDPEPEFALKVEDYGIAFDDQPLLENVSFTIGPHDKVALVGPNGTGKTTLLRELWRREHPGITLHPDVRMAFLSQFHGETLPEEQTAWELLESMGFRNEDEAAEYLSDYCLERDTMEHRIRTLSGGEKNLLQLAQIGAGQGELLLLDEPTSHLDLWAQLALEQAVADYKGAVLMVSHDFYSIANCVDYVLFAEDHTLRRMSGRAFRKMIYKRYFDQQYLELEQRKKELEVQITALLRAKDYKAAKELCARLGEVIDRMN